MSREPRGHGLRLPTRHCERSWYVVVDRDAATRDHGGVGGWRLAVGASLGTLLHAPTAHRRPPTGSMVQQILLAHCPERRRVLVVPAEQFVQRAGRAGLDRLSHAV